MGCERCGAPNAEFFHSDGAAVCRVCYYAEQTELQNARAEAVSLETLTILGFGAVTTFVGYRTRYYQ